jgi:hypothetical protein
MLATLLALTALAIANPGLPPGVSADTLGPPWPIATDETLLADSPTFKPCHEILDRLIGRRHARIDAPRFAHSRAWGWIMRARLVIPYDTGDVVQLFTCWSASGTTFKVAIQPEHMFGPPPAD